MDGKRTSALNSTNSSPRQSSSMIFFALAGACASYALGASLMLAECSRCSVSSVSIPATGERSDSGRRTLQFLQRQTKFASPLLPESSFCSYSLS